MKEVEYGSEDNRVGFRINKMLPLRGEELLMKHIVPFLGTVFGSGFEGVAGSVAEEVQQKERKDPEPDESTPSSALIRRRISVLQAIINGLGRLPYDHYVKIKRSLFQVTSYKRPDMDRFLPLTNDQENAFQGLEPIHIVLLVGEGFRENFTGSFDEIASRLIGSGIDLQGLSGRGT